MQTWTQTDFQSPHSRWLALTHRNPSSHSSFLYGVRSTKIYCRPTCSARLARRANVVFYDTADQARRDGFRACKRCKPDDPAFTGEREELVTRVIALLRMNHEDTHAGAVTIKRNLKELAKEVGVTPSYLCRVFKKTMGVTVGVYMTEFDKEGAAGLSENETVPEIDPANTLPSEGEMDAGAVDVDFNLDDWFLTEEFLRR